jgi:iron complex transport system substrate-binding protein
VALAVVAGCDALPPASGTTANAHAGTPFALQYARTFTVAAADGYRVIDLEASLTTWGGAAKGPVQSARIVLVPRDGTPPPLTGALEGATLVRTPAQRVAVNYGPLESMLTALGVADRIVAVGGTKSYDDAIRQRVLAGEIAQIGYGWHIPPNLDAVVAARPDVFLMHMGDLSHTAHRDRIEQMGIPVVPVFLEGEPDYRGKVEYIRLVGMLLGRDAEADAYVRDVMAEVDRLVAAAAKQPSRSVISAWWSGGDTWMATIRNADGALLRAANGVNLLEEPDDPRFDSLMRIGTERLLERGRDAECWILRDTHSAPFRDVGTLQRFRAYREGCLFASDGMTKPEADAFDFYERAVIRPDLILGDLVRMLHPSLRDEPFLYIRPDQKVAR